MTSLPPLLRAHIYELRDNQPLYLRTLYEGNIAFHGVLLKASRSPELASILWSLQAQGLWEYSAGFGVTMEDSALVMDGLLDAGWPQASLRHSLSCLVASFYSTADEAFHTLFHGRSAYWLGPSLEANAFAVYFIDKLACPEYKAVRDSALAYLLRQPFTSLGWRGRWFQQQSVSNFYVLRALASAGVDGHNLLPVLIQLIQTQSLNGSWNSSVLITSLNALCLGYLIELMPPSCIQLLKPLCPRTAISKARLWLMTDEGQMRQSDPLLYYWYESESPSPASKRKYFYHCEDLGSICLAWRSNALSETA